MTSSSENKDEDDMVSRDSRPRHALRNAAIVLWRQCEWRPRPTCDASCTDDMFYRDDSHRGDLDIAQLMKSWIKELIVMALLETIIYTFRPITR